MGHQSFKTHLIAAMAVFFFAAAWAPTTTAREFLCTVNINYRQLQGVDFAFLDDLKELVQRYINNNTWTNDRFLPEERIECSMQIVFQEALTLTSFRAQLILTSTRPIHGTTTNTTVLQINDNQWEFNFSQGTPLVFETERYDALTSVIDFYIYIMLGYDYDTFSEFGGEEHFQKAKRIQQLAAAQNGIGWGGIGGGRRAGLINQLTGPRFKPLREVYFKYHFNGLDHFTTDTEGARAAVLDVLGTMQELYDDLARQYVFDVFFSTKYQELTAIFEQSNVRAQAYALLSEIDPSHLTTYNQLVQ